MQKTTPQRKEKRLPDSSIKREGAARRCDLSAKVDLSRLEGEGLPLRAASLGQS